MDYSVLISKLRDKVSKIGSEIRDLEQKDYSTIIKGLSFQTLEQCANLDPTAIMVAFLIVHADAEYPEIVEKVEKSGLSEIKNLSLLNSLFDVLEDNVKKNNGDNLFRAIIRKFLPKTDYDVLLELYRLYSEELYGSVLPVISIKNLKRELGVLEYHGELAVKVGTISRRNKEKRMRHDLANASNFETFEIGMKNLYNKIVDISKKNEAKIKSLNKEMNGYIECIRLIEDNNDINILNFDKIIKFIKDEEIKKEYLEYIQKTMQSLIEKEKIINSKLKGDDILQIKSLFAEHGIDYNLLSKNFVENLSIDYENLKEMLSNIKSLQFSDIKDYEYIITHSNLNILKNYLSLVQHGVINIKYLHDNISCLSKDKANVLNINLKSLDDYSINPLLFINYNSILFGDSNLLQTNLSILGNYDLIKNIKSDVNLEFLSDKSLPNKLSILYELNLDNCLNISMNILSYDLNRFKRLVLLKRIGELKQDYEYILKQLGTPDKKYFVLDSDIDMYSRTFYDLIIPKEICQILEKNDTVPEEKFVKINFDDITCSSYNFAKNYNVLKDIEMDESEKKFYSIIYGSYYSIEEFEQIKEGIKDQVTLS